MTLLIRLLAAAFDLVVPRFCAGCRALGTRWCTACADATDGFLAVNRTTLEKGPPVHALAPYGGAARRFVIAYKDGRRELAPLMGDHFARGVLRLDLGPEVTLVPAPSRAAAARRRGGNHIALAATHAARVLAGHQVAAHVVPALRVARGTRDSIGLGPAARAANLRGALSVAVRPPPGAPVVLLDDVVTTGATLAASVAALDRAGVRVAAAVSFTATV
ncbi:MAG TPA: ComF family protein [Actinokineospora sp.]|nr:ComF family protein [Actinokineospora sp.]